MKINADLFEANYLHAFLLTENYITLTVSFTCSSHILLLLDSSIVYSNLFLSCSVPLISLLSGLDRLFFASFNITQRCIRYSMLHETILSQQTDGSSACCGPFEPLFALEVNCELVKQSTSE